MVDVSDKSVTERKAVAMARIHLGARTCRIAEKKPEAQKKRAGFADGSNWGNSGRKAHI
ncbi:MAG: hypothetical protein CM1200mP28_00920 [Deltaproteobacteria bacterium]|nr:MAG: hypothetical protein CM1200mP28_00920 [Deltaproteobacteria bacterium]